MVGHSRAVAGKWLTDGGFYSKGQRTVVCYYFVYTVCVPRFCFCSKKNALFCLFLLGFHQGTFNSSFFFSAQISDSVLYQHFPLCKKRGRGPQSDAMP